MYKENAVSRSGFIAEHSTLKKKEKEKAVADDTYTKCRGMHITTYCKYI